MSNIRLIIIALLLVVASPLAVTVQEHATDTNRKTSTEQARKQEATAEALVRQRVEDYATAVRSRDIDRVMSLYAPNVVSFDLNPPLRYTGTQNKRRAWQEFFATYTGPVIVYDVNELSVTADSDLAFAHSLNHVQGTLASGHATDVWVRWTACFRRINGVWLVVHDHVSVPADLAHGKAVPNLAPQTP